MNFNYYYGTQADQFTFVRIPKVMLTDKVFADLSLAAKMLYGVLLDRMGLSMKNGWVDEENKVYIIYQIAEIQEDLGFSKKKAIEYLAELEKFGLVEKKRRGLGLPSILYVKSFLINAARTMQDKSAEETSRGVETGTSGDADENALEGACVGSAEENTEKKADAEENPVEKPGKRPHERGRKRRSVKMGTSRGSQIDTSRSAQIAPQEVPELTLPEVPNSAPLKSNNNINNTYCSDTSSNLILSAGTPAGAIRCDVDEMNAYSRIIKKNIELDALLERYSSDRDLVKGIYELILETVRVKGDSVLIASNQYPRELVKSKFLKLDFMHIEYVISCFKSNTTKVKNIKKYLLAALFNAPSTIDGYYSAEVSHDFPQYAAK